MAGVFKIVLPDREVRFQLSYFDAADRDNMVLILNMVS